MHNRPKHGIKNFINKDLQDCLVSDTTHDDLYSTSDYLASWIQKVSRVLKAHVHSCHSVLKLSNWFEGHVFCVICHVALWKLHAWIWGSICRSRNEQVCMCVLGTQGPEPPPYASRLWTPAAQIRHSFPVAFTKSRTLRWALLVFLDCLCMCQSWKLV